ncbi:EAL and HDOD domain-containing protein [Noviherbaspirillum sp. Root189]|uniref:EAL and HDOD domain-containing protein n=1 Tax=Noviherbaspirillum sp. Root189 TaxID=1736487 RepID=UPI0007090DA4|nr:EAL domain-containing protein [Noviherbaspirillum sp. Root189]KRB79227.1 diguanylate phosphodiesterase [Noviherbaspirillum sp. Root189]
MIATSLPENDTTRPLRVREFFLARQPILDRNQALVAYELLFRNAATGPANVTSDLSATASVIAHTSQLGMEKVIGDALGYLNVDAAVLMSDIFQFLPREKVVLEIVETMKVTPEILARIEQLVKEGFRFALDDVIADTTEVKQLLPLVEIIKFDLRDMPLSALLKLTPQFKLAGKALLAEKVETQEQFDTCLKLGFDFFQGYYFAKPVILTGKKLSPSQLAIMQLMGQLNSDADTADIERSIKQDVSLCFNLLRLVNTPAVGARRRIDSVNQALMLLGRSQLQRWLQIMLYAEPCKKGHCMTPLLTLAATRGKLLELIAQQVEPRNQSMADTAFTVGIMSLMDTLFSIPMKDILEQVAVIDEVCDALLHRKGVYGSMLRLAEHMERIEEAGSMLDELIDRLRLGSEDLYNLQVSAFEWGDAVARSAH